MERGWQRSVQKTFLTNGSFFVGDGCRRPSFYHPHVAGEWIRTLIHRDPCTICGRDDKNQMD